MPTINNKRAPSHKAARITQRKQRRTTELLRISQPAQHILRLPHSPGSRILLEHPLDHRRNDMAGAERIDADPMTPPLHRQRARELDDRRLGRVVDGRRHALVGDEAAHAGDEQDGALLLVVEHLAGGGGGGVEDAVVVDLHDFLEGDLRVLERALQVVDAGGGDEAVEALVAAGDVAEERVHFCVVADVDLVVLEVAAVFALGVLFGGVEVGVGLVEAVQAVDFSIDISIYNGAKIG